MYLILFFSDCKNKVYFYINDYYFVSRVLMYFVIIISSNMGEGSKLKLDMKINCLGAWEK